MKRQPRGRLRPPYWNRTLATLRDAVRTGEINGTAGEMAAQVRTIIERADMLNYQPNTLITAVEWPMGWGEAIKPACAELGLKTLAEVHEAAKSEQGLRELSRKIAATTKINYLTDLARKVCGQLTEAEKKRQKYVEPLAEQKAEWGRKAAEATGPTQEELDSAAKKAIKSLQAGIQQESLGDDEPFPPFPEDEPTANARPRTGYHTCPADKIEKPEASFPRFLADEVNRGYHGVTGSAMTLEALDDRVTDLRDQLRAELAAGAAKYQQLFEEVGRIGEHVAEALGKLWVGDAATDPFIRGLVQHLPSPGAAWSLDDRRRWIHCAETVFSLMYKLPEQAAKTAEKRETAGPPRDPRAISSVDVQAERTARRKGKAPSKKRATSQPAGLIRRARQPIAAA